MFWQEDGSSPPVERVAEVVDVSFAVRGRCLPATYAAELAAALGRQLPPAVGVAQVGVRVTHLPDSGHGWWRDKGQPILLSRRARLVLRVGRDLVAELQQLSGTALVVDGVELQLGDVRLEELSGAETLYAHRVIEPQEAMVAADNPAIRQGEVSQGGSGRGGEQGDTEVLERAFMVAVREQLQAVGVQPRRMLCGRREWLATSGGWLATRSLLVDGMSSEAGLRLQESGLGGGSEWGCGFFVPHKAVV